MEIDDRSVFDNWVNRKSMALNTDLYELTMLAGFWAHGKAETPACFEYFFRSLPPDTGFAVFCGLEQLIEYLEYFRFESGDIEYLRSLGVFQEEFLEWLRNLKISADLWSVPEGSIVFPNEPIVRVEGPLGQVQMIETFLLNALNYPTLIATKAAKICLAAENDPVIEFGLRRAQGPDGGLTGSRAAYIGGCIATSNCLAGKTFGIPVRGTHAHSWVMAFPSEYEAFKRFVEIYPEHAILLVDTYDTIGSGVPNAIRVFQEMQGVYPGIRAAIRIDSGDLARLSKIAYQMFVEAGFQDPLIVASNDLDETLIADIRHQGARINSWGVGTHLITASDYPALGGVYKLVAIQESSRWMPKIKLSSNIEKLTNPGRKSIIRCYNAHRQPIGDLLCEVNEPLPDIEHIIPYDPNLLMKRLPLPGVASSEFLLEKIMIEGRRLKHTESLDRIRDRAKQSIASLSPEMVRLRNPHRYTIGLSLEIARIKRRLIEAGTNDS